MQRPKAPLALPTLGRCLVNASSKLGLVADKWPYDHTVLAQVFNSFGLGYRLTGESSYMDTVLAGADTLHDLRYDVSAEGHRTHSVNVSDLIWIVRTRLPLPER